MSSGFERLDLIPARRELEHFLGVAVTARDDRELDRVQSVLALLRDCPGQESESGSDSSRGDDGGWAAVRWTEGAVTTVVCWFEDPPRLSLVATWRGGTLESWLVSTSHRQRAAYHMRDGTIVTNGEGRVEGNIEDADALRRRAQGAWNAWRAAHRRQRWSCASCAFENSIEAPACALCRTPRVAGTEPESIGERVPPPRLQPEMTTTDPRLVARTIAVPMPEQPNDRRVGPDATPPYRPAEAPHFDVVLRSFRPERAQDVLTALRSMLAEFHIDTEPEELMRQLPSTVVSRLSIVKARELSDLMREAGGSMEIRRGRS